MDPLICVIYYQVVKGDACILVHELCLRKLIEKNVNVYSGDVSCY